MKKIVLILGTLTGIGVILYYLDVPIPKLPPFSSTLIQPGYQIPTHTGKYVQRADYKSPLTDEYIVVTVYLENDIIKNVETKNSKAHRISIGYQDAFENQIGSEVVGKNIRDIYISKVAGASGTTKAFMQAIAKIKANI